MDHLVSHKDQRQNSLTTTSPPTDSWQVQQYILYISHIPNDPNNALLAFGSKPLNSHLHFPQPRQSTETFSTTPPKYWNKYYWTKKKKNGSISGHRSVPQPHLQRILRYQTPCQLLQRGLPRNLIPKNLCFYYKISFLFLFLKFDYVFVQIFGFEEIESPNFLEFKVIWLNLPSAFQLHLIERNPSNNLPEGPWSATSPVVDPSHLPRGHHICFTVSNLDSFLQSLKVKYSFLFFFSFFTLHLFRILLLVILFGAN